MTSDDALYKYRLRVFALAGELDNVQAACRLMGVHRSTYYRWRRQVLRYGLEILRPRERRSPKMPNATPVFVEQRVLAFALGHPGFGPGRIAAELRRAKWGGIGLSPNGVWRVLAATGSTPGPSDWPSSPATTRRRWPNGRRPRPSVISRQITRAKWTRWTASTWGASRAPKGRCGNTRRSTWPPPMDGPSCTPIRSSTRALAGPRHWPTRSLRTWPLGAGASRRSPPTTVRSSRVTSAHSREHRRRHRRIVAGRPQSNGCVERLHETILEECWKPTFARHFLPGLTGLREELRRYLRYYNTDRAHTGRLTKGRTPEEVFGAAKMFTR